MFLNSLLYFSGRLYFSGSAILSLGGCEPPSEKKNIGIGRKSAAHGLQVRSGLWSHWTWAVELEEGGALVVFQQWEVLPMPTPAPGGEKLY